MHVPKVSIGMPVYNGEKYLREAIASLLEQDYTDFELIISDNASVDRTAEICLELARQDPRIRYYCNETNLGAGPNFRRVFEVARGEFFKWACSDDVHRPGCLRRLVEVLELAPERVMLVAPHSEIIDEESAVVRARKVEHLHTTRPKPHQRLAEILPKMGIVAAQFGLFRRKSLAKTRLLDDFHSSDLVLMAELAMLGEIWEIDEILFAYRYHMEVSTLINRTKKEFALWFNPKASGQALKRTLFREYFRSIKRLPLSPLERGLCAGVIVQTWLARKNRFLAKRLKKA
jgi:glycosyltransferase involved in cell wall biosynthesis